MYLSLDVKILISVICSLLQDDVYQIEFDGAVEGNPGPAGAGALVRGPDGSVVSAFTFPLAFLCHSATLLFRMQRLSKNLDSSGYV